MNLVRSCKKLLCPGETRKLIIVIALIAFTVIGTQIYVPPSRTSSFMSFLFPANYGSKHQKSSSRSSLAGRHSSPVMVVGSLSNHSTNLSSVHGSSNYIEKPPPEYLGKGITKNETNGNGSTGSGLPMLTLPPLVSPINNLSNSQVLQSGPAMPPSDENLWLLTHAPVMPPKVVMPAKDEPTRPFQSYPVTSNNKSFVTNDHSKKGKLPPKVIMSISEMNVLLRKSHATPRSKRAQWTAVPDEELLSVKSRIENAPMIEKDPELYAPLFWNLSMFKRSYELMEQILKVFIYREGEKPIFHQPILGGIYASEGWFMNQMEGNKHFIVNDPKKAHLFYLPFSSQALRFTLYVPDSHSKRNMVKYLDNYLSTIVVKYPFWNRTGGADHFLVACHDWAPYVSKRVMGDDCIRALCNADVSEGFAIGKDVSLPETHILFTSNPLKDIGGKSPSKRQTLAFYAGRRHGRVREILLKYWEDKDPDMKIFDGSNGRVKSKNYMKYMKASKYCICPKGYEVNSPRVVEAIFFECVPVIISDNYVPPLFEVLNWESFAVFVAEKDIPNLKNILLSIPERKYLQLQMRVKKVQKHFLWHTKPVKYDIFHMILHSVWFNRVFQIEAR